jgi:hypothetical protein
MLYCECEDVGSNPTKSIREGRVAEWLLQRFAKSWLISSWVRIPPRPFFFIIRYSLKGKTLFFKISIVGSSPATCAALIA